MQYWIMELFLLAFLLIHIVHTQNLIIFIANNNNSLPILQTFSRRVMINRPQCYSRVKLCKPGSVWIQFVRFCSPPYHTYNIY
jgi:hypothetical protein